MADSDEEWRFAVEDLPGEDGAEGDGDEVAAADAGDHESRTPDEDPESNVAGTLATDDEIEPGQPTLENAVFVALGAFTTLLLFLTMGGVL